MMRSEEKNKKENHLASLIIDYLSRAQSEIFSSMAEGDLYLRLIRTGLVTLRGGYIHLINFLAQQYLTFIAYYKQSVQFFIQSQTLLRVKGGPVSITLGYQV